MKLASLAALTALVAAHVSAAPVNEPTGIPVTSGLPFSSLSFDTTAAPSLLSALSSLISSESTAIMPYTSYAMYTGSGNVTATSPTPTSASPSVTFVTSSAAPTSTASGARRLSDSRSGVVAGLGLVLGVVAALVC